MGSPTFDTRFEESRKFCVRNDILKFFILILRKSKQSQVFKKRSEAVFLNAFILLLALSRNNDVIKLKKRSHQKQRLPSQRSARSVRHLAPCLVRGTTNTPKETKLTTFTSLFLGNAKSKINAFK